METSSTQPVSSVGMSSLQTGLDRYMAARAEFLAAQAALKGMVDVEVLMADLVAMTPSVSSRPSSSSSPLPIIPKAVSSVPISRTNNWTPEPEVMTVPKVPLKGRGIGHWTASRGKLAGKAESIRNSFARGRSVTEVAIKYDVTEQSIINVLQGKTYPHEGGPIFPKASALSRAKDLVRV